MHIIPNHSHMHSLTYTHAHINHRPHMHTRRNREIKERELTHKDVYIPIIIYSHVHIITLIPLHLIPNTQTHLNIMYAHVSVNKTHACTKNIQHSYK